MITAHSGCDNTQDNSLEFLNYAFALPAEALEVDVRKDLHDELIISHDETAEKSVTLEEVFSLLHKHPEKKVNCDLKQENLEADVVKLAKQYGVDHQLIFTGTVNKELFLKGSAAYPQVTWFANLEVFTQSSAEMLHLYDEGLEAQLREMLIRVLTEMSLYEAAGINWRYPFAELIWKKAKKMGIGISVWTVDDPDVQRIWLERDIENITSRNISGLINAREHEIKV